MLLLTSCSVCRVCAWRVACVCLHDMCHSLVPADTIGEQGAFQWTCRWCGLIVVCGYAGVVAGLCAEVRPHIRILGTRVCSSVRMYVRALVFVYVACSAARPPSLVVQPVHGVGADASVGKRALASIERATRLNLSTFLEEHPHVAAVRLARCRPSAPDTLTCAVSRRSSVALLNMNAVHPITYARGHR